MGFTSAPIFDADHHYYEATDAFLRHLPAEWKYRTVYEIRVDGRLRHVVGGEINGHASNPTFDPIAKPGALAEYFRGNPEGKNLVDYLKNREPLPASHRDPAARLQKMDEQGLQAIWMLPTLAMAYEESLQYDTEACGVAFRAFNRWLLDDWKFNYENRIFAGPYLTMTNIEMAIEEVEFAAANDARILTVRPASTYTDTGWRSPADPVFDPVWARIEEAGLVVVPHAGEIGSYGLERYEKHSTGIIGKPPSALQIAVGHDRAIANYLAALTCERLFERFPRLRIASVENGAEFLPLLLNGLRRAGYQRPGFFAADPVEQFREHVWITPFWEDDLGDLVRLMGPDRVLFGSDWPHPEGLAEPWHYQKVVDEIDDAVARRKILYDNAAGLTGL